MSFSNLQETFEYPFISWGIYNNALQISIKLIINDLVTDTLLFPGSFVKFKYNLLNANPFFVLTNQPVVLTNEVGNSNCSI